MSDDGEFSYPDYASKYALPDVDDEPLAIRLIQIQPRIGDDHPTESKIVLRMRVGQQTHVAEHQGRMSRFITKLKPKLGTAKQDTTLVPLSEIPDGEPKVHNRFTWGNYVAMSYSWGKKEDWEFTEKERNEAARKEMEENEKKRLDPTYKPAVTDEDDDAGTYTDGDVHEVILDGKRVRVRYNLWAALLAFREMAPFKEGIWLWNDALCINQQYETEAGLKDQARQLPLMSVIYRQAGNIIIHAGGGYHHDEDTPWVLEYLQDIGVNYRTEYYEALDHAEPTIAHSHRFQAEIELKKAARAWVEGAQEDMRKAARQGDTDYAMISLYDFFDRPYWRRLWIIQELAMAHGSAPILCGDIVTQWRYVRDGALLLSMMADAVRDSMQRALAASGRSTKREPSFEHVAAIAELAMFGNRKEIPHTDKLLLMLQPGVMDVQSHSSHPMLTATGVRMPLMNNFPGSPIHQSLTLAADAHCGFDKDRVLGLLALPALEKLPLQNNAEFARLCATDIYLQYAKACIKADHSLDIFSLIDGGSSAPDEGRTVPSWCPRFHVKSKIGRIEGKWHAQPSRPKYKPSDFESFEFETKMAPKFEGDNMICPGWVIDTVLCSKGVLSRHAFPQIGRRLKKGKIPILLPETLHRDDSFLYKRNWDFIQANRELPIAGKPLSSYFAFQSVPQSQLARLNRSDEHSYHKIAEAHRAMEARTRLRRLMTTSNRALMGLVPASTQQGDVVIILYYHSRPLIATVVIPDGAPEDTDDVVFKLKGEAFIPGVMNGELADSGELDTLPLNNLMFN
ncbi:uncharacterized protein VDAG_09754 [Verticillium dahliae VdLs.17]|uniref:Heterokaryon incompatibility domain-containing protein n=1 Tax=Verticillium dahliae (strain VdLs.17 / ATCC MYA-4575 / FGSC 10137) TaxID=498257 RepID=G2XHK0_VERDV|nr:uncharacterized protein VDAG_09754 [Verticillium dahliae VdLs.17]EGY19294.1 hypothetical protein VDAG_09754 [Verticillium dahliae VdLs.17]KAF3344175.1 SVP1-like protein 2 [Verticillium dahliae VDG2]